MANFEYQFAGQLNVPGAMLYNGREASYPIYESCSNLNGETYTNSISLNDVDNTWSVLPGYKIIVYQQTLKCFFFWKERWEVLCKMYYTNPWCEEYSVIPHEHTFRTIYKSQIS